jgi:hypothetical protein
MVQCQRHVIESRRVRRSDSLDHCESGEVGRLAAFGDRFDNPGRQKRQPHHAPHVTTRKMFSPGDLGDRPRPARQQIVGPSIRTGGRLER